MNLTKQSLICKQTGSKTDRPKVKNCKELEKTPTHKPIYS